MLVCTVFVCVGMCTLYVSTGFISYTIIKKLHSFHQAHILKCTIDCIEMAAIHHHLRVCPQFDIQYPELTAEEHLSGSKGLNWVALIRWWTEH